MVYLMLLEEEPFVPPPQQRIDSIIKIVLPEPLARLQIPSSALPKIYAMLRVLTSRGQSDPDIVARIANWARSMGLSARETTYFLAHAPEIGPGVMRAFAEAAKIAEEIVRVRSMTARQASTYLKQFLIDPEVESEHGRRSEEVPAPGGLDAGAVRTDH